MPTYDVPGDLVPQRIDGLESFSMLPVGTIFASAVPQTDGRVHLLDGSTISQTGIYKTFANLIKSLVAAGHNITYPSDTEFYSDVSTYGQCGKFVIDDTNGTIRLPLITEFIASNNGGKEIGLAQLDMFKSHWHEFMQAGKGGSYTDAYKQLWPTSGSSDGNGKPANLTLPRYSGSQGVQSTGGEETRPKNVRYPYYIVLAAGYKSDLVVDIDNIVTELNSKQDKKWKIINGIAGENIEIPVELYQIEDLCFRALGSDQASFGFLTIPRASMHLNGAYGHDILCWDWTGVFRGSMNVKLQYHTNYTRVIATAHGTTDGITIYYR